MHQRPALQEQGGVLSEMVRKISNVAAKRQILRFVPVVSLNAAAWYLGARDTCANLIDKAQLFKSYRQGAAVQILWARYNCANPIDKAKCVNIAAGGGS